MSFKAGDKVRIIETSDPAIVLEQDGDLVYIELNNGAEMEYNASALMPESEYVSPAEKAARQKEDGQIELALEICKVWDAVDPRLQEITEIYYRDISDVLSMFNSPLIQSAAAPDTKTGSTWDDVNSLQRLNILAVMTSTPVAVWRDAYENDKMSRLTLLAFANIGRLLLGK